MRVMIPTAISRDINKIKLVEVHIAISGTQYLVNMGMFMNSYT